LISALARVGLVAKGVSYGIVGLLALALALGQGGKATSRSGALATLARTGYGKVLLVLLACGFAAYALWRLAEAIFDSDDEGDDAGALAKRAGAFARGAIYVGLVYTALKLLAGSGSHGSQNAKTHHATAQVLSWPAGRWIVALAGFGVAAAGLFNGYRAVTRSFAEHWTGASAAAKRWGTRVGVVGLAARMVVFVLIGIFLVKAALDYNPKDAVGLDGALQRLASHSYGHVLLAIVAIGLVAYGAFCFVDARYRKV
jgi:hypothetical protein